METKTKTKLCWNCEGSVALDATHCPICGVFLEGTGQNHAPPYQLSNAQNVPIPPSPYAAPKTQPEPAADTPLQSTTNSILGFVFLSSGAILALFGTVLWLFADATGHLTLRWNAHYWFVYCLVSLPLLYFGWKACRSEDEATDA